MSSRTRHIRVHDLYKKAKTGKYSWNDLREAARGIGVSEPTVTSYLNSVRMMLKKEGLLK